LTIYIYGSESFKSEIHDVLNHSNIKFRLDDKGEIKDLKTLDELKEAIEDNPNNIYLIDDSKIVKKNIFTEKIKFLKPKDGISQEYLLDHGIGDVSVDSIDELSKHIIRRLDSVVKEEDSIDDIQDSIIEIVEGAYEEDSSETLENDNDENVEEIELDDELSALLSSSSDDDSYFRDDTEDEKSDEEALADILNQVEEVEIPINENKDLEGTEPLNLSSNLDDLLVQLEENHNEQLSSADKNDELNDTNNDFDELQDVLNQIEETEVKIEEESKTEQIDPLKDLNFDDNLDNINDNNTSIQSHIDENTQGEKMSSDFSEFDTLNENEILAALNGIDNVTITKEDQNKRELTSEKVTANSPSGISVDGSNTDDIAKLISQLLNNKTLEITIKVKE